MKWKASEFVPVPAEKNTGTGLPWVDVKIGDRLVSIFHNHPGHWYALCPDDGEVLHGNSFRDVRERLLKVAIENGRVRPVVVPGCIQWSNRSYVSSAARLSVWIEGRGKT